MPHVEMLSEQLLLRRNDVMIPDVGKFGAQAVARLRRSAAADAVREDDEIFGRIERLTRTEQLVAERGPQPVRAAAAGPMQEYDTVDDLARGIPPGRSERPVVQLELGKHFS